MLKLRKLILPALALASITTVALAVELVLRPDPENVVSARIVGMWKVEPTMTLRLNPDRVATEPMQLSFKDDATVLKRLDAIAPRLVNRTTFAAGTVDVNGTTYPYVLSSRSGNMYVTWFAIGADGTVGRAVESIVHIATAPDPKKDVLVLGGATLREPTTVYERLTR